MRVFVTGGTGAIGSYALPGLVAAGHQVSALARTPSKAASIEKVGAQPVHVSLFDGEALARALSGHDAVVNLASALPSTMGFIRRSAWRECDKVRIAGSATVAEAARRAGVTRLVQESVVMIYADGGSGWITESDPVDHFPISRGNHAAEASARRFADGGGVATVLRFGVFCGRGAAHSEQILGMARWHIGFTPGPHDGYLSSVHLADAAEAVVAALDTKGGIYNIVDNEPLTKREYGQACVAALGHRHWMPAPGRSALLLGDRMTSLTRSLRVSNKKFRDAAGWQPRYSSAREGFASMTAD